MAGWRRRRRATGKTSDVFPNRVQCSRTSPRSRSGMWRRYGLARDEARRMVAAVDAALWATLGLPADDDGRFDGGRGSWISGLAASSGASDAIVPLGLVAARIPTSGATWRPSTFPFAAAPHPRQLMSTRDVHIRAQPRAGDVQLASWNLRRLAGLRPIDRGGILHGMPPSDIKQYRTWEPPATSQSRANPSVCSFMRDEVIQQYLNNSAALAMPRQVCLLGAPRCHGVGMILGALGVSKDQVRDALLEGNAHGLGVDALRMLTQIVLNNEEELKLKYFKDDSKSKLCPVEDFLKAILDVPFAFKRVDAMLYIASFYLEVNQLRMSYATLEAACQEMRSSRLFHKVLEAVLNFGNFMSIRVWDHTCDANEEDEYQEYGELWQQIYQKGNDLLKWDSPKHFKHRNLRMLTISGFQVEEKFLRYVRQVMVAAVNLHLISLFDGAYCRGCQFRPSTRYPRTDGERDQLKKQISEWRSSPIEIKIDI
ncbi:hypothetical protein EJB05_24110, partial [Eragrostis curvula]